MEIWLLSFALFDAAGFAIIESNHYQPLDSFSRNGVEKAAAAIELYSYGEKWDWELEKEQLDWIFIHRKLMRNWPKTEEINRFPAISQIDINENISFEHLYYLRTIDADKNKIKDQIYRSEIWRIMQRVIRMPIVVEKRNCLNNLRDLMGYERFYRGEWPCPIN